MARRTYQFEILAKIDQALKSVDNFSDGAQRKLDAINFRTGISAIKDGFELVTDAAETAFRAIEGFAGRAIAKANEAEEADIRLANSLRLMGDLSQGAVDKFDALADSIASTTKFTDDMVKSSVAVAKQFKLTNAEAEKTIRVAADLAAIQGTTLEDATRKVAQTFNGFVDRDLAKVIPGLKDMGIAALVAGNAVDVIGKRVQGTAAALGNNFSGALFRAQEAFGKILETFGDFVIKNPAVIVGLNKVQDGFRAFNEELKKAGPAIRDLIADGFLLVIQAAPGFIETIQRIRNNVAFLQLAAQKTGAVLGALGAALTSFLDGQAGAGQTIFAALAEDLEALDVKFGQSLNASEDFFNPLIAKTKALVLDTTKAVNAARELGPVVKQSADQASSSLSGTGARMAELSEQFRKQIEDLSRDPVKVGFDLFIRKKVDLSDNDKLALGAGIVSQIVKGAQGAQKIVSSVIGAAADAIVPGIGGVVSEIVDVLAQGPEKTRQMVEQFARAIPVIIDNLIKSLPVLIETLARELPPALAKAMPLVAERFSIELIKNMPAIIRGFAEGLVEAAKQFVQTIIDTISSVGGIFGGGGGGGGGGFLDSVVEGAKDVIDSLNPFNLTGESSGPGRSVGGGDTVVGSGGGAQHITVQLVVNRSVLAEEMFKIRKAGFRI